MAGDPGREAAAHDVRLRRASWNRGQVKWCLAATVRRQIKWTTPPKLARRPNAVIVGAWNDSTETAEEPVLLPRVKLFVAVLSIGATLASAATAAQDGNRRRGNDACNPDAERL